MRKNLRVRTRRVALALAAVVAALALAMSVEATWAGTRGGDDEEDPAPIQSLKRVKPPVAKDLDRYIADRDAAVKLGKALFWDVKVGSDNKTACATCHFHAGVDNRLSNQVSPGLLAGDKTFQLGGAPNYTLRPADFPLTRFAHLDDPNSMVTDLNDIVSSQGVLTKTFNAPGPRGGPDDCTPASDAVGHGGTGFNVNGVNTRRVEPRHAPGFFNSIFNGRNFWDGRANNVFNGVDPFGLRNGDATVWKLENGVLRQVKLAIEPASLASQAVGPPLSENEMSCKGRALAQVGKKLLPLAPLSSQQVDPQDSVLSDLASCGDHTYEDLVKRAFKSAYWSASRLIDESSAQMGSIDFAGTLGPSARGNGRRPPVGLRQIEANFGFFMGLAIQAYQATLVSDDTPFDRYAEGNRKALSAAQVRGLALFRSARANCVHCHTGAEFTSASFANLADEGRLDARPGINNQVFRYDNGFFNTGVRPTAEDPGVGGLDPFGNALSETRLAQIGRFDLLGPAFDIRQENPVAPDAPLAIAGAFKTPGLRNVELTGPYFHNGGKATLMQVVDFYNRGGDFGAVNAPVTDPTVRPLGLSEAEKQDLVAFLLSLTDERVRFEKAPFDHPSICVPDGHEGNTTMVLTGANGDAVDRMRCIAAVGRRGRASALQPFLGLSPYQH